KIPEYGRRRCCGARSWSCFHPACVDPGWLCDEVTTEAAGREPYTKNSQAEWFGTPAKGVGCFFRCEERPPCVAPPSAGRLGGAAELPRERGGGGQRRGDDRQIGVTAQRQQR